MKKFLFLLALVLLLSCEKKHCIECTYAVYRISDGELLSRGNPARYCDPEAIEDAMSRPDENNVLFVSKTECNPID